MGTIINIFTRYLLSILQFSIHQQSYLCDINLNAVRTYLILTTQNQRSNVTNEYHKDRWHPSHPLITNIVGYSAVENASILRYRHILTVQCISAQAPISGMYVKNMQNQILHLTNSQQPIDVCTRQVVDRSPLCILLTNELVIISAQIQRICLYQGTC